MESDSNLPDFFWGTKATWSRAERNVQSIQPTGSNCVKNDGPKDHPLTRQELDEIEGAVHQIVTTVKERAAYSKKGLAKLEGYLQNAVGTVEDIKSEYGSAYLGEFVPLSTQEGIPVLSELLNQVKKARQYQDKFLPTTDKSVKLRGGKMSRTLQRNVAGLVVNRYLESKGLRITHFAANVLKDLGYAIDHRPEKVAEIEEADDDNELMTSSFRDLMNKDKAKRIRDLDYNAIKDFPKNAIEDLKKAGFYDEAMKIISDIAR